MAQCIYTISGYKFESEKQFEIALEDAFSEAVSRDFICLPGFKEDQEGRKVRRMLAQNEVAPLPLCEVGKESQRFWSRLNII